MDGHKLPFYRLSGEAVLDELRSTTDGLSSAETSERLRHLGPNRLETHKAVSGWKTAAAQFKNPLVLVLLIGAGLSLYSHDSKTAIAMAAVALANALLGFFLGRETQQPPVNPANLLPDRAKVLRAGKLETVASSRLVPGDIIYLEAGIAAPADARIIATDRLAIDSSALTGTPWPVRAFTHALPADVPLGDRRNMLHAGATVAAGSGYAVVTATGPHTELGRILNTAGQPSRSPLGRDEHRLATRIAQTALLLAIILCIVALPFGLTLKTCLLFAVSLAAALVPSSLPAAVSATLTQIAHHLARTREIHVRQLSALSRLSAVRLIVDGKIGLLTTGEMTARRALIGRSEYTATGTGYGLNGVIADAKGKPLTGAALKNLHLFFQAGILSGSAAVSPPSGEHTGWYVTGDPAEGALLTLARKAGLDAAQLEQSCPERGSYAFDRARGRQTSLRAVDGQLYAFVQGTPESILASSTELWDHGHVRRLTAADQKFFAAYCEERLAAAERTVALAYRVLPKGFDPAKKQPADAEQQLVFLGIASLNETLPPDLPATLKDARSAGLALALITEDEPALAGALARHIGFGKASEITVLSGDDLPSLDDSQLLSLLLSGGAVFSRIDPADKLRIAQLLRSSRCLAAITGSSLSDLPALRHAAVSIAPAGAATAASDAAAIALPADGLGALITTTQQSRLAAHNVKKIARSVLTDNLAQLITVLLSLPATAIWGVPAALTAIQILAIQILAGLLPAAALGWDKPLGRLPKHVPDSLLNRRAALKLAAFGALAAALAYANYLLYFARHHVSPLLSTDATPYLQATILACLTLVLCQFMNLLLTRTGGKPLLSNYLWSNKKLLAALAISLFLMLNVVYNPLLQAFFGTGPLTGWDLATAAAAAALYAILRVFRRHAKATSRKALLHKHAPAAIRAHLHKSPAKS